MNPHKSPLQTLLNGIPGIYWTSTTWPLLQACFFWNGFPIDWNLDDLKKPDHFPSEPDKQNHMLQRIKTLAKMYHIARQCAKKKLLLHRWIDGEIHFTPFEFARLCAAQRWYPVARVWRELDQAPKNICLSIAELFYKRRPTPSYATQLLEKEPKSIRQWFRKEFQHTARKLYCSHKGRWGKRLTPKEIYKHKDYQRRLKTLKHPVTQELSNYSAKIHIREWIPKVLPEKLARGRPPNKKSLEISKKD